MKNQQELLDILMPSFQKASTYQKNVTIKARVGIVGESLDTIINGEKETSITVTVPSYVIENPDKEQYIVKAATFNSKYDFESVLDDPWNYYKAKGQIKAIYVDEEVLSLLGEESSFHFVASWGSPMLCNKGDYLVSSLDYSECYRIESQSFLNTYIQI